MLKQQRDNIPKICCNIIRNYVGGYNIKIYILNMNSKMHSQKTPSLC